MSPPHGPIGYLFLVLESPFKGAVGLLRLLPDHRHPETVKFLLEAAEAEAQQHDMPTLRTPRNIPEGPPYEYLHRGFQKAGFSIWHYSWRMRLSTAAYQAPARQSDCKIQPLTLEDGHDLALLGLLGSASFRNYPGFEDKTADEFQKMLETQRDIWDVELKAIQCLKGEHPVGFGIYYEEKAEDEAGWLHMCGVHPDHQGRGYGSTLLHHMIGALKTAGVATIGLSVESKNESAIRLYEKCGFQTQERRMHYRKQIRQPTSDF